MLSCNTKGNSITLVRRSAFTKGLSWCYKASYLHKQRAKDKRYRIYAQLLVASFVGPYLTPARQNVQAGKDAYAQTCRKHHGNDLLIRVCGERRTGPTNNAAVLCLAQRAPPDARITKMRELEERLANLQAGKRVSGAKPVKQSADALDMRHIPHVMVAGGCKDCGSGKL